MTDSMKIAREIVDAWAAAPEGWPGMHKRIAEALDAAKRVSWPSDTEIHEEFKKHWADVPSQDNEGYVPDRGGFKFGWKLCAMWLKSRLSAPSDSVTVKLSDLQRIRYLLDEYIIPREVTNKLDAILKEGVK